MFSFKQSASVIGLVAALGLTGCGGASNGSAIDQPTDKTSRSAIKATDSIFNFSETISFPDLPTGNIEKERYVNNNMTSMTRIDWNLKCGEYYKQLDHGAIYYGSKNLLAVIRSNETPECSSFFAAEVVTDQHGDNFFIQVFTDGVRLESQPLNSNDMHETAFWKLDEGSELVFAVTPEDGSKPIAFFRLDDYNGMHFGGRDKHPTSM